MQTKIRWLTPALLLIALSACSPTQVDRPTQIAFAECRLPKLDSIVQCAEFTVPENYTDPQGRKIKLHIARLPANTRTPHADPLLLLAGGPGQAASDLAPLAAALERVRRERDIVLIDQRGTGRSAPLLCENENQQDPLKLLLQEQLGLNKLRECLTKLDSDPRYYTTVDYIADLEAVLQALGYSRVNLWGASYGTRVALEYLRRHPERIRSAILDGVAPNNLRVTIDAARSSEAALERVFADCAKSASCHQAFPQLKQHWHNLLKKLAGQGERLSMVHPQTGQPITINVTDEAVIGSVGVLLYAAETRALIPQLISTATQGDFAPLFTAALRSVENIRLVNQQLQLAVLCAEESQTIGATQMSSLSRHASRRAEQFLQACQIWPHRTQEENYYQPVKSDKPVLIFSGALDPVTPPEWAEQAMQTLSNARHIVAPGFGHNVSPWGCGSRLIAEFISEASAQDLSKECIAHFEKSRPVPFYTSKLGAMP